MNAQAQLSELNALPLYLNVQTGESGRTLPGCAEAWPTWRRRLLTQRPLHRPATADVLLLTAFTWPVSMLHLAVAFVHHARLEGEVRLDWPEGDERPFHDVHVAPDALGPSRDPLHAATEQLLLACDTILPATRLNRNLLLNTTLDRAVQAMQVLGNATGDHDRAAGWADQLARDWPTRNRTRLDRDTNTLTRTSCCCHYLDAKRCENCPITTARNPRPHAQPGGTP